MIIRPWKGELKGKKINAYIISEKIKWQSNALHKEKKWYTKHNLTIKHPFKYNLSWGEINEQKHKSKQKYYFFLIKKIFFFSQNNHQFDGEGQKACEMGMMGYDNGQWALS